MRSNWAAFAPSNAGLLVLALVWVLSLGGCRAPPSVATPREISPEPIADVEPCRRFAGPPGDLDLRGIARTHPVRCCASDHGFDPELARRSCGFREYLGESDELACVHRFRGDDERIHELRLTPILDLDLVGAIALHERSGLRGEQREGYWWSGAAGRRWAYVGGWPFVRRLGWDEAACEPTRMDPVLIGMAAAALDPEAEPAVRERLEAAPEASRVTADETLLDRPRTTAARPGRHPLPRAAALLVDALLATAAAGDLPAFAALLEPGARIGLPDRRELGARSILAGDDGAAAARALVRAAARFPASAELRCPALDRRVKPRVARGEALMWCVWMSEDGLDLLVFGLRGRVVDGQGDGRVAYVGLFPERPLAPLSVPGEPPPPPVVVTPELVCGDPHARSFPGLCPEPAPGEDEGYADAP